MMFRSSPRELEEFFEGAIWQDIMTEMTAWLDDLNSALQDLDETLTEEKMRRLQGSAKAIHMFFMLSETLPDNVRKEAENDREGK